MTPDEIKQHFGKEALDMLYDCILQNTTYALADWILELTSEKDIATWIGDLKADEENIDVN
jgi:hypothetical protein